MAEAAAIGGGNAGGIGPGRPDGAAAAFERPYVVSWNLTYRCNLACEHCYLDAGPGKVKLPAFSDRSELTTEQCFRIVDQILAPRVADEADIVPFGLAPHRDGLGHDAGQVRVHDPGRRR